MSIPILLVETNRYGMPQYTSMNRFCLTTIRECRSLTPVGWGILSMIIGAISFSLVLFGYPFLAPTHPIDGEVLVVEGWLPDYALEKVKDRFQGGNYKLLITTGGNLTLGHHLSKYKTWAELAAATLHAQGISLDKIIITPTTSNPQKDRTYNTALAVRKRLGEKGWNQISIDVVSFGPHSRRTWFMFKKVFSSEDVGIITLAPKDYDINRWWLSSAGVRDVISEVIAYLNVRLIFSSLI